MEADDFGSSHVFTEGNSKSTHGGIRYGAAELVQRVEYTPFGKERFVLNGRLEQGPKFTDQPNDIEDGLYFYQSRYYDPVLGRFIQPDTTVSNIHTPQSLNAYSYVQNNPLRYTDPTGHEGKDTNDDSGDDDPVDAPSDDGNDTPTREGNGAGLFGGPYSFKDPDLEKEKLSLMDPEEAYAKVMNDVKSFEGGLKGYGTIE